MSAVHHVAVDLAQQVLAPDGSELVLTEQTADGNTDGTRAYQAPLHRHPESELWYVLDGALGVRVGDDEVEVRSGGAVIVPGGTPHTFWNSRPEPVRYLLVMGPRTHALVTDIHASTDRGPRAMRALFESHGAELLEDPPTD